MSRQRAIALAVIGLAATVGISFLGWRDLHLTFFSVTTTGRIVDVNQPPPGRFRQSDYQVRYEFIDSRGQPHIAVDEVPTALAPGQIGSPIQIRYNRSNPLYSGISSQVSNTSFFGLVMGILILLQGIVSFLRGGNEVAVPSHPDTSNAGGNASAIGRVARRMKCPACGAGIIQFRQWARGVNAFSYQCPQCGSKLRASRSVIAGFVCALLMLPAYIWAASALSQLTNWPANWWFTFIIVVGSGLLAYATWRTGSYSIRAKSIENSSGGERMEGLQSRDHF
jgi:predicted RNA-binding Zn-ribbon protein involved in translation (DUF1610 family)